MRFAPGGKERKYAEKIARVFFVPFMRALEAFDISTLAQKHFQSYRPLENEQKDIEQHAEDLKEYRSNVLKKEAKIVREVEMDVQVEKSNLEVYLESNTKDVLRPVADYLERDIPKKDKLKSSSNKTDVINVLLLYLEENASSDKIDNFIEICDDFTPKLPYKKKNAIKKPPKEKERKFSEVLSSAPNEELSLSLLSVSKWPFDVVLPFPPSS